MKSTGYPDPEKIECPFQGEELCRNILSLVLYHIKLLDLGNGVKQIPGSIDSAGISGNDLGVGIACFFSNISSPGHFRFHLFQENDLLIDL